MTPFRAMLIGFAAGCAAPPRLRRARSTTRRSTLLTLLLLSMLSGVSSGLERPPTLLRRLGPGVSASAQQLPLGPLTCCSLPLPRFWLAYVLVPVGLLASMPGPLPAWPVCRCLSFNLLFAFGACVFALPSCL